MGLFDLSDRLNWRQAAALLGVRKSSFFRLVNMGEINAYGLKGCSFYLRSEIEEFLLRREMEGRPYRGRQRRDADAGEGEGEQ